MYPVHGTSGRIITIQTASLNHQKPVPIEHRLKFFEIASDSSV